MDGGELKSHIGGRQVVSTNQFLYVSRRLLLIGRLDEAERTLAGHDPAPLPAAWKVARELVLAGIARRAGMR